MVWLPAFLPCPFSRQKVLGKYIADFYSAEAQLIIELDGSQHYEADEIQKDADRTAFLEGYGLTVIRIPNNEVNRNFRGVCEYIDATVKQSLSQLRWQLPLHKGAFPKPIHNTKIRPMIVTIGRINCFTNTHLKPAGICSICLPGKYGGA